LAEVERYPTRHDQRDERSRRGFEDDEGLLHWPRRSVFTSRRIQGCTVRIIAGKLTTKGVRRALQIANKLDGAAADIPTMGCSEISELKPYFNNRPRITMSKSRPEPRETPIVPDGRILGLFLAARTYLETMEGGRYFGGLSAKTLCEDDGGYGGQSPSRRWYPDQRGETPAAGKCADPTGQKGTKPVAFQAIGGQRPLNPSSRATSTRA